MGEGLIASMSAVPECSFCSTVHRNAHEIHHVGSAAILHNADQERWSNMSGVPSDGDYDLQRSTLITSVEARLWMLPNRLLLDRYQKWYAPYSTVQCC